MAQSKQTIAQTLFQVPILWFMTLLQKKADSMMHPWWTLTSL